MPKSTIVLALTSYFNPTHLISQRSRRRTRSSITRFIPNDRHLPFLGFHSRHPLRRPPPHLCPSHFRLPAPRSRTTTAATLVDRTLASIVTVKICNATPYERRSVDNVLNRLNQASQHPHPHKASPPPPSSPTPACSSPQSARRSIHRQALPLLPLIRLPHPPIDPHSRRPSPSPSSGVNKGFTQFGSRRGEATCALDPTSRILVLEALKG